MPLPQKLLQGCTRDYDIERLVFKESTRAGTPNERQILGLSLPPWQRPEVWTTAQRTRLVESIFLGLGCGYYVTNGMEWEQDGQPAPMAGWLIDGQQRIASLRDFLAGELEVFGDTRWDDLTLAEQRRFLRNPFPCFELDYTNDEAALLELYDRLNFGGTAHTEDQRPARVMERARGPR